MNRSILILISGLLAFFTTLASELSDKLTSLAEVHPFTFEPLATDTFFEEKYVLYLRQDLDHNNPASGAFTQRIFLSHRDFGAPVVFITEGYAAGYGAHPRHLNEVASLLGANQVCVEHRYFGESVPDTTDWQYLTIYQAATDHHEVVMLLRALYSGKWVNTGISKGGQTTMYHRYFYPDDVEASVGYVCPLNFSREDRRVYTFLAEVGDPETREKVVRYQQEMLKNKTLYLPEFEELAAKKKLNYRMGLEKAYELTVLEYSFAFWQWGTTPVADIPIPAVESGEMVKHLNQVAGINWISDEGISDMQAFFYQALTELGFYGYDIGDFKEWVSFDENPVFDFTAPPGTHPVWNPEPMIAIDMFIRHKARNMIFIYGETDPWSSTAVELTGNSNLLKVVKAGGSHLTRISNLPEEQRNLVLDTLKGWLKAVNQ